MTGLPPLGMGCAGLGNLYRPVPDEIACDTVAAALDAGIAFFDVAPHYGFGLAEERLGAALGGREDVLISTKVGRLLEPTDSRAAERHGFVAARALEPVFDYRADAIRRSTEQSLSRLRRDRVEVLLAHDLGALTHGQEAGRHMGDFLRGGYRALRDLRDQGIARAIGIGVNEVAVCHELLDAVELDVILLAGRFTLLEQRAALPLLERCARLGVRIVAGGPFNSGILAEGSGPTSHFDYATPPPAVLSRVAALEAACARFDVPLAAAAIQFPLRHRSVASVIPGMVGREQVEAAVRGAARPIPAALWDACRAAAQEQPA